MAIITDNATNNDIIMKMIEETCKNKNIAFSSYNNYVRCLVLVINLATQNALAKLKVGYIEFEDKILNDNRNTNDVIPKVIIIIIYYIINKF